MVSDLYTTHLVLHALDLAEAQRIVLARLGPGDSWADDYPFEGDLVVLEMMSRAGAGAGADPRPFGYHRISRRVDGRALGGIGFKGAPVNGALEVGYGLVPSARGQGYAREALRAGFRVVRDDEREHFFEVTLGPQVATGRSANRTDLSTRDVRDDQTRGQG